MSSSQPKAFLLKSLSQGYKTYAHLRDTAVCGHFFTEVLEMGAQSIVYSGLTQDFSPASTSHMLGL